jgi:DNA-binding protein H-NS
MDQSITKLEGLSVDELSALYDHVRRALTTKIQTEKRKLEERLASLNGGLTSESASSDPPQHADAAARVRRAYPAVRPKYQNPANLSETWAGRGKQPKWLVAELSAGRKIEDFLIRPRSTVRS